MNTVNHSRAKSLLLLLAGAALLPAAQATVVTFDTATSLTSNFSLDTFAGDTGTQWHSAYAASGIYAASNGGFVHLNNYDTPNSLKFKSGPVFLNGFTVSSQYSGGGAGVSEAAGAGRDFMLELYDSANNLLSSKSMLTGANGSWDFVNVDVAGVQSLRILATWTSPGIYDGWWPNIDNVTYNQAAANRADVPEPGALALVLAALGGVALTRRRGRAAA